MAHSFYFTVQTSLWHLGVAGGQSTSSRHWTHVLASLQNAVGATQLALVVHWTQTFSLLQIGVMPEQFCGPRHCTQRELATSHFGVAPPH